MLLEVLPSELVLEILSLLSARELAQSAVVSRTWNELASSSFLWRRLCLQNGLKELPRDQAVEECDWRECYRQHSLWKWNPNSCGVTLSSNHKTASLAGTSTNRGSVITSQAITVGQRVSLSVQFTVPLEPCGWVCVGVLPAKNVTFRSDTDISCVGWSLWSDGKMRRWPQQLQSAETVQGYDFCISRDTFPLFSFDNSVTLSLSLFLSFVFSRSLFFLKSLCLSGLTKMNNRRDRVLACLPVWRDGDVITLIVDLQDHTKDNGSLTFLLNGQPLKGVRGEEGISTLTDLLHFDSSFVFAVSVWKSGAMTILHPGEVNAAVNKQIEQRNAHLDIQDN
ncbi:F-box WD repeat-containing protein [Balamuthia mandrillaris]